MNFKRIIAFLMICLMLLSVCACKKDDTNTPGTTDSETEPEATETTESDTTTSVETEPVVSGPQFINPLTGLESDVDLSKKRPVSIMVNNIGASLPQSGIYYADILFECLAEGGITRLMMISTEYEKLPKADIENITAEFLISADILNSILQYNSKELTKGTISKPVQKLYYVDEL